jgi:coenzyme F420-reducing hydrogenase alpha subunit
MTARATKTIRVNTLARVEGEGSLYIKLVGERVADVKLKIYEPPRFFEAFLRGRHFSEAPDITARICGICPIAYQMSAVHAIEKALGIQIAPAVRLLRRLFYCGEWIESHTLHVYMLHAPDFLGYADAIAMAKEHRAVVEKALRLKKIGNRIVQLLGGREIHPISAAVGGFFKVPTEQQLRDLVGDLEWALEASLETVRWTASLEFPNFEQDYEFVALRHEGEYPFNEGRLVSNRGLDIDTAEYEDHFVELHVKHSNALHAVVRGRGSYLVGPLARFNLNFDKLPETAQRVAIDVGLRPPVKNIFRSIVVRAVELVFACAEALRAIREYEPPAAPRVGAHNRSGVGQAITEAPRGILYHRYALDENGKILAAKIVPPTSQNQKRIEDDLREYAPRLVATPIEEATWKCEQAIRSYDPCISCATHFLKLSVDREEIKD